MSVHSTVLAVVVTGASMLQKFSVAAVSAFLSSEDCQH